MNTPYPAEIIVMPRRRAFSSRPGAGRTWLLLLALVAVALVAFAWGPAGGRLQAARPAAAVTHRQAAHAGLARAVIRVTVGKTAYSCTVPLTSAPRPRRAK